mmetsp:Transcript_1443/g.4576  ORF Transcript_1443/g.4576 Transcript_1443/m.4576 type:complete len:286 (+) Transcript_1443:447-1304(+)
MHLAPSTSQPPCLQRSSPVASATPSLRHFAHFARKAFGTRNASSSSLGGLESAWPSASLSCAVRSAVRRVRRAARTQTAQPAVSSSGPPPNRSTIRRQAAGETSRISPSLAGSALPCSHRISPFGTGPTSASRSSAREERSHEAGTHLASGSERAAGDAAWSSGERAARYSSRLLTSASTAATSSSYCLARARSAALASRSAESTACGACGGPAALASSSSERRVYWSMYAVFEAKSRPPPAADRLRRVTPLCRAAPLGSPHPSSLTHSSLQLHHRPADRGPSPR